MVAPRAAKCCRRGKMLRMKAVLQRVTSASVHVDGRAVAQIGLGLLVLLGVTHADTTDTASALARKVYRLRIMRGERSVADLPDAAVLVVSQFTLYGDAGKGRRPSWLGAAPASTAEPLVGEFVARLRSLGARVATGEFRADMQVASVNDGPVTVVLEM